MARGKDANHQGEIGPIQVRPGVAKELKGAGILPARWNSNLQANLTAGALYYDSDEQSL